MKTATTLRILLTLATGAAGAVFAMAPAVHGATASNPSAPTQSFQISPPTANYNADPGGSAKGTIKVTNLTANPLSVRVGKENFVAKGEEGEIELTDNADPQYSLAPWFTFDAPSLDIPGKETRELHYTVSVPTDAEPGGRYGSITFNSIPPKLAPGESGAAVQQTIAAIVFLRINGPAKEELSVASFAPDKDFYEYGPVALTTRIKNSGNVHEKPTGKIVIKNLLGFKVGEVKLDEHFVIPGAIRKLHNSWPTGAKKPLLFGRYTAELDATYAGGKHLTAKTSFTVIPWKPTALALIVLLVLLVLLWRARKRLGRALRILAGRE
jgi:hypothetical protein